MVCLWCVAGDAEESIMDLRRRFLAMFPATGLRPAVLALIGVIAIGVVVPSGVVFSGRSGTATTSVKSGFLSARTTNAPMAPTTAPIATPGPSADAGLPTTSEPMAPSVAEVPSPAPAESSSPPVDPPPAWGCAAALAYLSAQANPTFSVECPGNAFGHQAMTCSFVAGYCPDGQVIAIAVPCPAAYMNEAENSWVLLGLRSGPIDPYGSCS
jgi:hypothetical protein